MISRPVPLDEWADAVAVDEFCLRDKREIQNVLKRLLDGSVLLSLVSPDGRLFTSAIWSLDGGRGTLGFNADPIDPAMHAIVDGGEATVVGYLDKVKIQFDIRDAVLVHGSRASVLSCAEPREVYRFQRREAFRVRPLEQPAPTVTFEHPDMPGHDVELRLIDVSSKGCALFLPHELPSINAGSTLPAATFKLNADTRFVAVLRLQHVTAIGADSKGVRLGFEFVKVPSEGLRALQRYIDLTQKRGKLMALS